MKVLIVGNGGREHALAWKIAQSSLVSKIYCTQPNAGIIKIAESVDIPPANIQALADFALKEGIDLTVVGPEMMLADGIVDLFEDKGLKVFGPCKAAAEIEASKTFAKNVMRKYNIPTADFNIFSEVEGALDEIRAKGAPIVLKADGLAAGKGVIVATSNEEAEEAAMSILDQKIFGEAGNRLLIEKCLVGTEATFLAFTDGTTIVPMPSSQDHKRAYDGDEGKNTGGMGAFSPSPLFTPEMEKKVIEEIVRPLIEGLKSEGIVYKGVIYTGLMITEENEVFVIEFNCRFGDPEAQIVIPRLKTDIVEIMNAIIEGKLDSINVEWSDQESACVVLCSGGYPESYPKGIKISIDEDKDSDDIILFHAGTKAVDGSVVTNGGRVMAVCSLGKNISDAVSRCYTKIKSISFEGMHYRTDIGRTGNKK